MSPYEALRGKVKDATPMDFVTKMARIFPLSVNYALRNIFRNRLRMILTIIAFFGPDALPDSERLTIEVARMLKEDFLQQNAFHDVDSYCPPKKQNDMLKIILEFSDKMKELLDRGIEINKILELPIYEEVARMKYVPAEEGFGSLEEKIKGLTPEIFN